MTRLEIALIVLILSTSGIASSSLQAIDAPFVADIAPGASLSHDVEIRIPDATEPMNFEVEIWGFGQDLYGGLQFIPADQYSSEISAINMIRVAPTNFSLEPDQSQIVTITADMPSDAEAGTKYAIVLIRSIPSEGNETIRVSLAAAARVQLTMSGSDLIRTGDITDVELKPDGNATLILKNTGNTDFKASAEAELSDDEGKVLAHATSSPALPFGIFPTYSGEFFFSFNPDSKLTPGKYTINATAKLEDGTVIASKEESISIK